MSRPKLPLVPLKKISLAVASVVFFLGTSEYLAILATDHGFLDRYSPMVTMVPKATEDWRLAHITADKQRIPDPVLWWKPFNKYPYNSHGFKGREIQAAKRPGVFRIIGYGDSNTDGPFQGGWPDQLQAILDASPLAKRAAFEVVNAGVSGYSSHQGLLRFKQEYPKYNPDLILVSFGWNDLATALGKPDKMFTPPPAPIVHAQRLLLRFRFYLCLKHYFGRTSPPANDILLHRVPLEDYLANMKEFLSIARGHGIKIAFLTRPHQEKAGNLSKRPGWRGEVPSYNRQLLRFGRMENVLVIDVQKMLENDSAGAFMDECHLTSEGFKKMSRFIFRELTDHGLLSKGP